MCKQQPHLNRAIRSGLHPEFTDNVVQTANDRAHMLSKIHAEVAFNDPNTLQNILATLQRLEVSQARVEARLDNAAIVKRNRLQLMNNSGSTVYIARRKQVAGDGLALATVLAPPNLMVPGLQGNSVVGATFSPTIDAHTLNHGPILSLIRFYNEDFGITLQDTVPIRAQKVSDCSPPSGPHPTRYALSCRSACYVCGRQECVMSTLYVFAPLGSVWRRRKFSSSDQDPCVDVWRRLCPGVPTAHLARRLLSGWRDAASREEQAPRTDDEHAWNFLLVTQSFLVVFLCLSRADGARGRGAPRVRPPQCFGAGAGARGSNRQVRTDPPGQFARLSLKDKKGAAPETADDDAEKWFVDDTAQRHHRSSVIVAFITTATVLSGFEIPVKCDFLSRLALDCPIPST
ncbi:hypothetical protein DFH08DRAFT_1044305 [Mycena albidolilacea]|uniref:Uncharacterized protein n=1 Tax=Mycena albidolilacea TaxID=1033008 RepID=A0AAD7EDL9_9AGAR|nr:hypothetical protein DFH08DRAFT_1044305 [Mycena albidolilacea]